MSKKEKKYITDFYNLMKDWNFEKNEKLGFYPDKISYGSAQKVWWVCKKGHEWMATPAHRKGGTGCPYCSNRKIIAGENDLATLNPRLASEWHPTKNGNITPKDVGLHDNSKFWWICERGHEWESTINNRRINRCRKCSSELQTSFPEQAIYFYLKQVTAAENRFLIDGKTEIDVYLPDLKIGIEYDGLRFHKGEKAQEKENRKNEKLKKLGVYLIRIKETHSNFENTFDSNIIYSKATYNYNDLTNTIKCLFVLINLKNNLQLNTDINVARDNIDIYEYFIKSEKENSLLIVNPELVKEWHPTKNGKLLPEYVRAGSNKIVWWKCCKGHEWKATINSRNSGVGCPICANKVILVGYNDLATVNPKLASEWNPIKNANLTPETVAANSNKIVWWKCCKGHEWTAKINDRNKGRGCPICANKVVLAGYNDLKTLNPKLASEWHPIKNGELKPTDVTCGAEKYVWWHCNKNHEWQAYVYDRNNGKGCPYCTNMKILIGFNDLATVNPKLASEWHPTKNGELKPTEVFANSNKNAWWVDVLGHEWSALISSRNNGRGCPYCTSQMVLSGFNDLATVNPKLASEWHPTKNGELKPTEVFANSNKKAWWICDCGNEWPAYIYTRNKGVGCPECAKKRRVKKRKT